MKKYLNFFCFFLVGSVFGAILIVVSEFFSFSHVNLAPFGGKSWALWVYPIFFIFGFIISSRFFKIKNNIKVILLFAISIFVLFFLMFGWDLFVNFIPFGR